MRATLIYNPKAGKGNPSSEDLVAQLQDAGYTVVHEPTPHLDDLDRALEDPGNLVVVAGGDGTVRAVATRLVGRNIPLAVLPFGTANNISKTMGESGAVNELIAGLARPRRCNFDLGLVNGPWGKTYFLEAAGIGLFAHMMAAYASEEDKNPRRALHLMIDVLANYQVEDWQLKLDGEDASGRYLLVEAMNIGSIGPNLRLAPQADTCDGQLEVVFVREEEREDFAAYLARLLTGQTQSLPELTVRRGKHLQIVWNGSAIHLDDEIRPALNEPEREIKGEMVEVELQAGALEFWLPENSETS